MIKNKIDIERQIIEVEKDLKICEYLLSVNKNDFRNAYKNIPTYPVGLVGAEKALELFKGKWKHAILMRLLKYPSLRYSIIKRELEEYGITDYMLASSLHELVADKLVTKKIYAEVPVRVEYSVTEKGIDLWYIVLQFSRWYHKYNISELKEKLHTFGED